MPGASTNCKHDTDYVPDFEMEEMVIRKTECIPKWSTIEYNGLNYCTKESDFERYFKANIESQEFIANLPNKCKYNTWNALHYEEEKTEGNTTLQIILISINPKVSLKFEVRNINVDKYDFQVSIETEVYIYTTEYFIGTFGGYLGLFLGGSLLGLLEMVEKAIITKIK